MALRFERSEKNNEKRNELVLEGSRFRIGFNMNRGYDIDGISKSMHGTIDLLMDDSVIGRATFNHKINPKNETGVVYAFNRPGAFGVERVIRNKDIYFIHEIKNKSKATIKAALRNGIPYYTNDGDYTTYNVKYRYGCVYQYKRKVTPLEIKVTKKLVSLPNIDSKYQQSFDFIHKYIFKLSENSVSYTRGSIDEKFSLGKVSQNTKYNTANIISSSFNDVKVICFNAYAKLRFAPAEEIIKTFGVKENQSVKIAIIYLEDGDTHIDYKEIAEGVITKSRKYTFKDNSWLSQVVEAKDNDTIEVIQVNRNGEVTRIYTNTNGKITNKLISANEYAVSLDATNANIRFQKLYKFGEQVKCLCSIPVSKDRVGILDEHEDTQATMFMLRMFAFADFERIQNGILLDAPCEDIQSYIDGFNVWFGKIVKYYYPKPCRDTYKNFIDKMNTQMKNYMEMIKKTFGDEVRHFRFYIKQHDSLNIILACEAFHYHSVSDYKISRTEFITNIPKNRLDKYIQRIPEEVTSKSVEGVSVVRLKTTDRYTLLPNRILKELPSTATNYQSKDALMVDLYNMIVDRYERVTKDYDISKDEVFDILNHI